MIFKDKTVLITGGAGFIGSRLATKLISQGSKVVVADNLSRGRIENINSILEKVKFHQVDLTNLDKCLLVTKNVDYVFHLAASVGGIQFITKENVGGLTPSLQMNTNMLEAARINDVDRFLFTSSACVYRDRETGLNKFKEEDAIPSNPLTTYGWAKIIGEIQCKAYHQDYGIKCSSPRLFNAYGENESLDPKWSHVIPSLIRKAILYPTERFTLFGDGKQERAFLYVDDCIDGLLLNMEKVTNAEPLNLGSDGPISTYQLAERIINISKKKINIEFNVSGPRGTNRYCADTHKMKNILAWKPKISLDIGLSRTYEWVQNELCL